MSAAAGRCPEVQTGGARQGLSQGVLLLHKNIKEFPGRGEGARAQHSRPQVLSRGREKGQTGMGAEEREKGHNHRSASKCTGRGMAILAPEEGVAKGAASCRLLFMYLWEEEQRIPYLPHCVSDAKEVLKVRPRRPSGVGDLVRDAPQRSRAQIVGVGIEVWGGEERQSATHSGDVLAALLREDVNVDTLVVLLLPPFKFLHHSGLLLRALLIQEGGTPANRPGALLQCHCPAWCPRSASVVCASLIEHTAVALYVSNHLGFVLKAWAEY
mmetsp:Transcript_38883/g.110041  ORF Transcript_38883/g.110041 Transcript_38883/m.110041 type:complete len:270 (+) Transcript_38883:555-1364(+)